MTGTTRGSGAARGLGCAVKITAKRPVGTIRCEQTAHFLTNTTKMGNSFNLLACHDLPSKFEVTR